MLFAARSRANALRGRSECSCLSIFLWNQALATVSCTVCRPHLPKVLRAPQLLTCEIQIELSLYTVLCTFCRQLCQINQRPQPRKQRPTSATPGATLPKQKQGFAPESVFTREFTSSRTVTSLYRSHTRTALANYVDDMVTKLPLDICP